jgi:hypothetical protein
MTRARARDESSAAGEEHASGSKARETEICQS